MGILQLGGGVKFLPTWNCVMKAVFVMNYKLWVFGYIYWNCKNVENLTHLLYSTCNKPYKTKG